MHNRRIDNRISILDGFRTLAIIAVMCFHYYSTPHYKEHYYPYGAQYDYFRLGYLGVEFFFIISGFVISSTLFNTDSFSSFWKKRWIRLFPSMLVASLLIYIVFLLFITDTSIFPQSREAKNMLVGLTFTSPDLFNKLLFANTAFRVDYLNGSFWSLWLEIQFYLFASLIYFLNKKNFIRNYVYCAAIILFVNWLMGNISGSNLLHIQLPSKLTDTYKLLAHEVFSLPLALVYFSIGVLFNQLYQNKQSGTSTSAFLKVALFFFCSFLLYAGVQWDVRAALVCILFLFFIFIYYPRFLSFLENKTVVVTGVASYFIYLVHEPFGVAFTYLFAGKFHGLDFLFPVFVSILIISLSILYTKKIDQKISAVLKNLLLRKVKG